MAQSLEGVGDVPATLNGAGQSHSCGAEQIAGAMNAFESDVTSMVKSVRALIGGIGTQANAAVADMEAAEESNIEELRQIRFPDEHTSALPGGSPGTGSGGSPGTGGGGGRGPGRGGTPRYTDPGVDGDPGVRHTRHDFPAGEEPPVPDHAGEPEQSETPDGFSVPVHNMRYDIPPGERQIHIPDDNWGGPYIYRPDEDTRPPINRGPDVHWGGPYIYRPDDPPPPIPEPMKLASDSRPDVPHQFNRDNHNEA